MGKSPISSPHLLPMGRSLSLKNRERIRELFRSAKRRSSSSLTVFYRISNLADALDDRGDQLKLLIAVPKRTGNAVLRNKVRRGLRESIRLWPARIELAGELIVRYNPPREQRAKGAPRKTSTALDKKDMASLRREVVDLLDDVVTRLAKN